LRDILSVLNIIYAIEKLISVVECMANDMTADIVFTLIDLPEPERAKDTAKDVDAEDSRKSAQDNCRVAHGRKNIKQILYY
jgi:hypothetical protein